MAQTPFAISVVTTLADVESNGTTVSPVMSQSMDPPMMATSLDNSSTPLARLGIEPTLGINVLAADQSGLASHFAMKRADKFADIPWSLLDGAPSLPGHHDLFAPEEGQVAEGHTGICFDKAVAESFFASYKTELIHTRPWPLLKELEKCAFTWIDDYHNRVRRRSKLDHLTPTEFELGFRDTYELAA